MANHPEMRDLETAVEKFVDQIQRMRASNGYDDATASQALIPLCAAVVKLIKVAAEDQEIIDILTTAGAGTIDALTARIIVEYSWRAERDTVPVRTRFSEWMRLQGAEEEVAWIARQMEEQAVIQAEQAGIIDRLIRVLNNSCRS